MIPESIGRGLVLIGPVRVGKSTVGHLLGQTLGVPFISLDEVRWPYYREIGYQDELATEIRQKGGFLSLAFYWKLFDVHAVERMLADHQSCVFELGAGASVSESDEQRRRLLVALKPCTVILLLPSPDAEESIRVLQERTADLVGAFGQGFDWNRYFVEHPTNHELADHVIYTRDQSPDETCASILRTIGVSG